MSPFVVGSTTSAEHMYPVKGTGHDGIVACARELRTTNIACVHLEISLDPWKMSKSE